MARQKSTTPVSDAPEEPTLGPSDGALGLSDGAIEIVGARTHNLKNLSCNVRRGMMTVVTGLSGSGKSSLAFDTLYAEGQRRYVESLSTYARQFLEKIQRPDVDAIRNIPPAIALEQRNSVTNARSTIGTATEINDYLRLLFARVGHVFCPDCDIEVESDTVEGAAGLLAKLPAGTRLVILAPVEIRDAGTLANIVAEMKAQGFARALAEDGTLVPLEEFREEHLVEVRRQAADKHPHAPKPHPVPTGAKSEHELEKHLRAGGHDVQVSDDEDEEAEEEVEGVAEDVAPFGESGAKSRSGDRRSRGNAGDEVEEGAPFGESDEEEESIVQVGPRRRMDLVADRVAVGPGSRSRLTEALELAFRAGGGHVRVHDPDTGAEWAFSEGLTCNRCGRSFRKPEPGMFSFSSPLGACVTCQGFGRIIGIDLDKVVPDWNLTLKDKPVAPWNTPANREMYPYLKKTAPKIPWNVPLARFTDEQRRVFIEGEGDWCGVNGFFKWFEGRRYKVQARVMLAKYRAYTPCPDCHGTRLKPDALSVRIDGHTIAEVCRRSVEDLHEYFDLLRLSPTEELAAARLLDEIRSRLHYLDSVGLGYLTLDRQTRTLSGGESQRINLSTALGSALTDTLYVLDEPTVGLHSRDTFRLLGILKALRENGNTVVVVEHDPDIILGADDVIDIGPASGDHGGRLLYAGPLQGLARSEKSITAKYLAKAMGRGIPSRGRAPTGWITIRGARENNLKNVDVRIPRGVLCCVTGVSGSGKSTLVHSILYAGFRRERDRAAVDVGAFDRLEGIAALEDILLVDQKPIGRSARSNPVTYVKAYDEIRKLFAATREAKAAGIKPGHFSFNVAGGRCETCEGAGVVTIDMHFLADVEVTCDACDGKRFRSDVLGITWRDKNIDDVLAMTVNEAQDFFAVQQKVVRALAPLDEVGLGYLRLGQSTATLSGGEAQRLKLAGFLAGTRKFDNILMVFDEPTTGLHSADLERLIDLLQALVDRGVSVLVIEHNMEIIGHADWIIDLGPEGGDAGGRVVAEGAPRRIMDSAESHTGKFLRDRFKG